MRVVVTGSSGRVGGAIFRASVQARHGVIGIDRLASPITQIVADFADTHLLRPALEGADAVIHTAALHAPHVGVVADEEFLRINVAGTRLIAEAAIAAGVRRLVFTSTTALYGHAVIEGSCTWIDETTLPQPKTIYHQSKLAAEGILEEMADGTLAIRILRMSRSFPEPAEIMAAYRLHRGIDIRDVASAHVAALTNHGHPFQRHLVSAETPFRIEDCQALATNPAAVITARVPALADAFRRRGWRLPATVDRIYHSVSAHRDLEWRPRFGFEEVLAQLDSGDPDILQASR